MIRDAAFSDIPGIILLLQEGFARSHYAREGKASIDEKEAKRLLFNAIQRHGGQNGGGCWVQVAGAPGEARGLILGNLQRPYSIGTKLFATDLFWLTGKGAPVGAAYHLMRGLCEWAKANPAVIETKVGTTTAIMEDPEEAGIILRRLGFKDYGRIWRLEH